MGSVGYIHLPYRSRFVVGGHGTHLVSGDNHTCLNHWLKADARKGAALHGDNVKSDRLHFWEREERERQEEVETTETEEEQQTWKVSYQNVGRSIDTTNILLEKARQEKRDLVFVAEAWEGKKGERTIQAGYRIFCKPGS